MEHLGTHGETLFDAAWLEGLARAELFNRSLQGYDLTGIEDRIRAASGDAVALKAIYEDTLAAKVAGDFPYEEPNGLGDIQALRPDGPRTRPATLSNRQRLDRIHGALLGRVIGVVLGRPVEGEDEAVIRTRLESTGDYPLADYFHRYWLDDGVRKENSYTTFRSTREGLAANVGAEPDDDLNYVLINLCLLEKYGAAFTTLHVGYQWLESFPVNWSWGPERTAYINLARFTEQGDRWRNIDPDTLWRVTHYLHESSELIGAQIRADVFGYVLPGQIERAAEWAWRDAARGGWAAIRFPWPCPPGTCCTVISEIRSFTRTWSAWPTTGWRMGSPRPIPGGPTWCIRTTRRSIRGDTTGTCAPARASYSRTRPPVSPLN